jgi:hypothetical protein
MIEMSEVAKTIQGSGHGTVRYVRIESWLGGELLADDIPFASGREECDRSARVPERISLRIPREESGRSWVPDGTPGHPLAANGQRLRVLLGVGIEGTDVEWIQRGEFLIQESEPQGEFVAVIAVGLLALVDEARFIGSFQPNGTMSRSLRYLLEPALPVILHPNIVDRNIPGGINYDEDRLGAALELLAAWPANGIVTESGYFYVTPADLALTTAAAIGNVNLIERTRRTTRDDAANCVVAKGTAPDGAPIQAVSYVQTGPLAYLGDFSPFPVPRYFSSPLLISVAACRAAANAIRDRIVREQGQPYQIRCLPMTWLQVGDRVVLVDSEDVSMGYATIEALSLPYTPGDDQMSLTVVME